MKTLKAYIQPFAFMLALIVSLPGFAKTSPCLLSGSLAEQNADLSAQYTQDEIYGLRIDLEIECEIQKSFAELSRKLNIENTQLMQGIRYVTRYHYETAKTENVPLPKIYQLRKTDYKLPLEERTDEIWQNFARGYAQLPDAVAKFSAGRPLTISDMRRFHAGFYKISDEIGDFAHEPYPGQFLYELGPEPMEPWWKEKTPPSEGVLKDIKLMNEQVVSWGMLDGTKPVGFPEIYLVRFRGNDVFRIHSTQHAVILKNWLGMMNVYSKYISSGYRGPRPGKLPLMSPLRLALYAQKVLVAVHPFTEGNGRNSRFYQDLILNHFGLPSAPSGDLMENDTLANWENYYNLGMIKFKQLAQDLKKCVGGSAVDYDCRPL